MHVLAGVAIGLLFLFVMFTLIYLGEEARQLKVELNYRNQKIGNYKRYPVMAFTAIMVLAVLVLGSGLLMFNGGFRDGVYAHAHCWAVIDTLSNGEVVITEIDEIRESIANTGIVHKTCSGEVLLE